MRTLSSLINTRTFLCLSACLLSPGIALGHAGETHDNGVSVQPIIESKKETPLPINVGGPFSLTDHFGNAVTNKTYLGKHMLVFFGYANCEVMCPISLHRIGTALSLIEEENAEILSRLAPLIVTVDPDNDSASSLKAILEKHHSALIGLTGSKENLGQIYKAYKQSPSSQNFEMNGNQVISHTSYFYLMGPDGELQTFFPPVLNAQSMAGILKKYIDQPN